MGLNPPDATKDLSDNQMIPDRLLRTRAVLDAMGVSWEMVFADDGSTDATPVILRRLNSEDARIGFVSLSRNFGKEIALTAGLDHARGQAAVVIDADLQDPPEVIPELVARWHEG
jgi:glycosyltransferase involved in cell wall biosynthesis